MSLPENLIHLYRADDGVTPAKGSITWDGSPTITVNGVEPGEGPTVAAVVPGADGAVTIVRVRMKTASVDIVGDVHLFGPIYVCSEGVKVKISDSVSLYATDWIVGDVLDFTGQFLGGMQRCGLLNEYYDPAIPEEPPVYPPSGRIIKLAALPYGVTYTPFDKTQVRRWIADKFDFVVNGGADTTFQSHDGYIYAIYASAGTYIASTPEIRAFCDSRGWLMDDMFTHISIDYVPAKSLWKERDKFFSLRGSTDISNDLYLNPSTITFSSAAKTKHIGKNEKFSYVDIDISNAAASCAVLFKYWNGSAWASLTVTDLTSGLAVSGRVSWAEPVDWTKTSIGVGSGYWIRIEITGTSSSTVYPIISRDFSVAYMTEGDTTANDVLSLGQYDPFDQINVELVTAGVGGTLAIQYWNGATWAALTVTDATSGLTVDGSISFIPPANWARNTVGTVNGYWVRVVPTGYSTAPVIKRMYADNWLSAGNTMCRGWDATSSTIINSGELLYNPTPPSTATAKFRHQGRVTGYWSPNQMRLDSSKYIGDVCLAAEYFIYKFDKDIQANPNANGIMWDTAFSTGSTWVKTPSNAYDYMDIDNSIYPDNISVSSARFKYVVDRIHIMHPSIFVSANLYNAPSAFVAQGDANLLEYYQFVSKSPGGSARRISFTDAPSPKEDNKFRVYDGLLPANNPTGVKCIFMYCADVLDYSANSGPWDKANRDPILCLAKHLIAQNDNVYFCYHYEQDYSYDFSSEILTWKFTSTITSAITTDLTDSEKTIYAADLSGLLLANSGLESRLKTKRRVKIGDDILVVSTLVNNNEIMTTSPITGNYAEGTEIRTLGVESWINRKETPPRCADVYAWPSFYFPAMDVDVGVPDVNGHNGGAYDLAWKTAAEIGGPEDTEIWRRDYTKAIILVRAGVSSYETHYEHYKTPCAPIDLGGTYYPLSADGTVGEGITSIALRAAEGAILLKSRE